MFEDDLGDDFLTSWKPTKMAADIDDNVQPPKSIVRKTFASSKLEMDFDFDGGFSKLSSFDIDLSFDSPPYQTKKAKKIDSPKSLKPDHDGHDQAELAFDFKGFDGALDLEGTTFKKVDSVARKSEPNAQQLQLKKRCDSDAPSTTRVDDTIVTDRNQSDSNLRKYHTEDPGEGTIEGQKNLAPTQSDAQANRKDTESFSPLLKPDCNPGHHSSDGRSFVHVYDHEKSVSSDRELTKTASTTTLQPVSHTACEGMAEDSCIPPGLQSGKEINSETRLAGEHSLWPERSDTINEIPGIDCSDKHCEDLDSMHPRSIGNDPLPQGYEHMQSELNQTAMPTGSRLSPGPIMMDKQETCVSLDSRMNRSLQFDPLSKSSLNDVPDVQENCGPPGTHELKGTESTANLCATTIENSDQNPKNVVPCLDERTNPASIPVFTRDAMEDSTGLHSLTQVPVSKTSRPRTPSGLGPDSETAQRSTVQNGNITSSNTSPINIVATLPNASKKSEDPVGSDVTFSKSVLLVHCAGPAENLSIDQSVPNQALAVHFSTGQNVRINEVKGKQVTARKHLSLGQLNLETVPRTGNRVQMTPKAIKSVPNELEAKLGASKRPISMLLPSMNRLQLGPQQTSHDHISSQEEQGESGHDEHARTKKAGRQESADRTMATLKNTTAARGQGIYLQSSGVSAFRPQTQLSSRPSTTSKFFSTSDSRYSDRNTRQQMPSPAPGNTTTLTLSSLAPQTKKAAQSTTHTLLAQKSAVKKGLVSEVARSKAVEINRSSRDSRQIKYIEGNEEIIKSRPPSSLRTTRQNLSLRNPQTEAPKFEPEKTISQEVPLVQERSESPALHGARESLQKQTLSMAAEIQMEAVPSQSPVDLLISERSSIMEQANEHTDKLDTMLKTLKKLNDDAKDLIVRALITNNKLMILNSPMTEDKNIKVSVMEALGQDHSFPDCK